MNKTHQHAPDRWLKQQSALSRRWLRLIRFLGLASGILIVAQAWLLAKLLDQMIVNKIPREALLLLFVLLLLIFVLRAWIVWLREKIGFIAGQSIRQQIRCQVLDRLHEAGPAWIQGKPAGSWATLILEQIEDMHDYYARYLPQMSLAITIPLLILVAIFPVNWMAALILLLTAPLIPLFMALVGMGAADANRRNFQALARLSGYFLDRLRGMETLRLFHRGKAETANIGQASQEFRLRTMDVLRLAFLSSGTLEFFASLSIALVAVYFGFSYLGEFNIGHYSTGITLFAGFLALILAPEFFQPLRDLGTFYHAKAQASGAADSLLNFMNAPLQRKEQGRLQLNHVGMLNLQARDLIILSCEGEVLAGPLNFTLQAKKRTALVGQSGAGKSTLLQAISGFLPYRGHLTVNGIELSQLDPTWWRQQLSWIGQNPQLPAPTLRDNILLGIPSCTEQSLHTVLDKAFVSEFLPLLPLGLETPVGDNAARLSLGQAQRVAVARALLTPCQLLLLDEPGASLDAHSEQRVMAALESASLQQTTLMVTHQLDTLTHWDEVWVMHDGKIVQQGTAAALTRQNGPFASLQANRKEEI